MFDTTQDGSDLFASTETVDETANNQGNGEVDQPLTESKSKSAQVRQGQIDKLTKRVLDGEIALNAIPKDLAWMKPFVAENVERIEKATDIDAIVEAKLRQREAEQRAKKAEIEFKTKHQELLARDLEEADKQLIQTKFNKLVQGGADQSVALTEAIDYFDTLVMGNDLARKELYKKMAIKVPANQKKVEDKEVDFGSPDFFKSKDSRSRVAVYEAMIRSKNKIVD